MLTNILLSMSYETTLLMISSSNPVATLRRAGAEGYAVSGFMIAPLELRRLQLGAQGQAQDRGASQDQPCVLRRQHVPVGWRAVSEAATRHTGLVRNPN